MPRSLKNKHHLTAGTIFLVGFACLLLSVVLSIFSTNFNMFAPCANSASCIKDLSGNYEPGAHGIFLGKAVAPPRYIARANTQTNVLGENTSDKHIYVDLTHQTLYAYEGDKLVYSFPVSTGKWNHTPTGDFKIWIKLRYTRMSGGSGSDYYNLPNVPYTMFYYNDKVSKGQGYSLHGAYWHNNFGYPMSHGCVNMRPEDVEKIYNWVSPVSTGNITYTSEDNPSTPITIYGETPAI